MAQLLQRPGAQAPVVNPPKGKAPWPVTFYRSAVGKKWVMAITGIGLLGFVIAHMIGNLKVYLGRQDGVYAINEYGEALRTLLHPIMPDMVVLWIMRIGLIAMLILHVHAAASLTIMNRKARPVGYQSPRDYVAVSFASKSMRYTGIIVFLYLIFHLLDLTIGATNPDFIEGDVYQNMVTSMSRPAVAVVYILANIAVAIHLFHGIWSMFQSLGINNPRYNAARRYLAMALSGVILVVNVSFPVMILAGVVS